MAKTVAPAQSWTRPLYFTAGLVFVGLGYLGTILPVMPGTIFFILALNCFRRSNERLEHWLLSRPVIGPMLREWDERGCIRPHIKRIILVVLWLSIIGSVMSAYRNLGGPAALAASLVVVACAIGVTWFVVTRPNA